MSTAPGYFASQMKLVLARDLFEEKLPGDEPEPLEVVPCKLSELDDLLLQDDFTEARTIAAFFMVRELKLRGEL